MSVNTYISTRRQTCKYIHEIMFTVHCAAVKMGYRAEKIDDACYKENLFTQACRTQGKLSNSRRKKKAQAALVCLPLALGSL